MVSPFKTSGCGEGYANYNTIREPRTIYIGQNSISRFRRFRQYGTLYNGEREGRGGKRTDILVNSDAENNN